MDSTRVPQFGQASFSRSSSEVLKAPDHNTGRLVLSPVGSSPAVANRSHTPRDFSDRHRRRVRARRLRLERAESRLRACGNGPAAMCRERNSTGGARAEQATWGGPASTARSHLRAHVGLTGRAGELQLRSPCSTSARSSAGRVQPKSPITTPLRAGGGEPVPPSEAQALLIRLAGRTCSPGRRRRAVPRTL